MLVQFFVTNSHVGHMTAYFEQARVELRAKEISSDNFDLIMNFEYVLEFVRGRLDSDLKYKF